MKLSTFVFVAAVAVIPSVRGLTVNTPSSLDVCQPSLLSWSGGTPPYYPSILPGGEISASALKTFDSTNATQYTWTVDIAAGTAITIQLKDSTGTIAYSDQVTISSGTDTSCVSTSVAASASAGSTSAYVLTSLLVKSLNEWGRFSGSSASSTSGSTVTSTSSASGSTSSSASTTSSASSSSSSNAASRFLVNNGVAGFLGIIGLTMLT
ncbi:hypothetical protein EV361DRAFT_952850 [Lentinula raphanica]|nr:hypothetical protein EV361DRAFT_952850 [Lentinula raphanica]